jgi:hypothetical protein
MWKLGWFLRDFLYDPELLAHEQVDEKALTGLRGVVKISHTVINGISLINLDSFAQLARGKNCPQLRFRVALAPTRRRLPDDLFLHPDQSVPQLPAPLPAPLP